MAKIPFYSIKSLIGGQGGGGGTTEVKIDGVTVEKLTGGKLQANAIIPVTDLPTTDIKLKSIYQKQDGEFVKNYIYVNNKWQSVSIIDLTAEQYDALTDEQKTDGTLYIVSDDSNPQITWTYSALAGKPVINGVTIDGKITLEDLQLYSRNEVNNLLAQKGNALFVDELPTEIQPLYWYYSKKYQDGTPVVDGKRALYIKDNNGVLLYMGVTGDVDLANYYTIEQANDTFIQKSSLKIIIDDTATDTDVISGKAIFDFYKNVNIEDVTSKLKMTVKDAKYNVTDFKVYKIGEHFLYLRFKLKLTSGSLTTGMKNILSIDNIADIGIKTMETLTPGSVYGINPASAVFNGSIHTVYFYCHKETVNPNFQIAFLLPTNF